MKKKKALEDKKKELDEQAAAALAVKKSKLQKETPPAHLESEIDLGVFSAKRGNLLEQIYAASGSQGVKPGKSVRKVDISKITPLTSPPSRSLDLSPPHVDLGEKRKEDVVEIEQVGEGGAGGDDGRGGGDGVAVDGEDTLEFEAAEKALSEEREKFNAEKKGLAWRVADAEEKLSKEKQLNVNKQKEWETACERTNRELQTQRDTIVRLSGEKTKISEEAEQERAAHQKREQEYIQRIAKLEKFAAEKVVESKASEIVAEEVSADCKWLLARVVPLISERIAKSDELAKYMFELGQAAYNSGRKDGYGEGRETVANNEKDYHFELYKQNCTAAYSAKRQEYEFIEFGIVKAVEKLSRKANAIEVLKKALGDQGTDGGDAGPSHQG
ncbi:hypothetical protein HanPI659440_Chr06g0249751 [Helianthus annuus]|nr:hypothetical protein HanPI659440_Chr06g0249751 [Helianthus annuus]